MTEPTHHPAPQRDRHTLLALCGLVVASIVLDLSFVPLLLAAFFLNLAVRHDAWWAWIPGGIFAWKVVEDLLFGVGRAVSLPVVVMAAGGLLLLRDRVSDRTLKIGLVVCLVLALASIDARDHGRPPLLHRPDRPAAPSPPREVGAGGEEIPALDGRLLAVETDDGDVTIRMVEDTRRVRVERGTVVVEEGPGSILVRPEDDDAPLVLAVPAGAVDIDVRTNDGDVRITALGDPTLTLGTDDGNILVSGFDGSSTDRTYAHAGTQGRIGVKTDDGDIVVTRRERVPR